MTTYTDNKIDQVRPGSTFEAFEIYDPEQQKVVDLLKRVADQLIGLTERVLNEEFPFDNGKVLFLWSKPGFGKTHLVEAFINRVKAANPELLTRMFLSRGSFRKDFDYDIYPYGTGTPVVIIDDMFHDMQSVNQLHPSLELASFMRFITQIYDRRVLAIVTSNFPLLKGGIVEKVEEVDKVGRVASRMHELLSLSGEIHLNGKDFRQELATRRGGGEFTL